MTNFTARTTSLIVVALLGLLMATIWLTAKPTFVSGSTYALSAAVVMMAAAIAINAWKNAQATTSTSQVIHDAEISPSRVSH